MSGCEGRKSRAVGFADLQEVRVIPLGGKKGQKEEKTRCEEFFLTGFSCVRNDIMSL